MKYFFIFIVFTVATGCDMSETKFDSIKWKQLSSDKKEDLSWKASMVSQLLKNELKVDMTKENVIQLLGKPDYERNNMWYYNLGVAEYGIDEEFLKLIFSKENLLLSFNLARS